MELCTLREWGGGQLFTFHSLTIECKTSKVEMPSVQQNSIVASYASRRKGEAALIILDFENYRMASLMGETSCEASLANMA